MRRPEVKYFQVIITWVRRDGLHMSAVKPLFSHFREAMDKLNELERTTEPFYHYQVRGLREGEPETLEGVKVKPPCCDPVKLYAIKAGEYEAAPARWSYQWARSAREARELFGAVARFHRARHIHRIVELTLEQETEWLKAASASEKLRLLARYGEPDAVK